MSTDNEIWQDASHEEGSASRDGNQSFNRENNYNRYGNSTWTNRPRINREGNERPYRPRINRENGERPYRSNYGNRDGGARPYRSNYNNESGERPYRPNYGNRENGERPYRPNYNREGGERPRTPRTNGNYQGGYNRENGQGFREGGYNSASRPNFSRRPNNGQQGFRPNPNRRPRTADYDPNAKYSKKKQIEYKEQYVDPNEPIRLNKFLANAGICSRREADEFITAGVVTVNGEVVTELGTKVKRSDVIKFHDQPVSIERKIYVLLNKPKDCVTTSDDPQERRTVMDLVKGA